MSQKIPNSVIGAVASVIAEHYYSHSRLNTLFMESGAPGDSPEGNCETKCSNWLKRCNDDTTVNALEVLGAVVQEFMDQEPPPSLFGESSISKLAEGQTRITKALAKNQLAYRTNGYITQAGSTAISKKLEDFLKSGDFSSIEKEFERAVEHINGDPHASITAACSIIEATLKFYIERFSLAMPKHKVLKGISSIIDGVGAFRSHIGSAHGRGTNPPSVIVAEARLVVNAAHTIVIFMMELIHAKKSNTSQ